MSDLSGNHRASVATRYAVARWPIPHREAIGAGGGFGITYHAWDNNLERFVAIKEFCLLSASRDPETNAIFFRDDARLDKDAFEREGRNLARVKHPNVPAVYENFLENNTAYLVMEFINGTSLKSRMPLVEKVADNTDFRFGKRLFQPLPEAEVRRIIGDLVDALDAAHTQNVYHLDIKPDNILVDSLGKAFLIDFGAARQKMFFSTNSSPVMTPAYAPYELLMGLSCGPESDIFSLGMMLHEMLPGELPPSAMARYVPPTASWYPGDLAEPWQTVVKDALQMQPETRPKDVHAWWSKMSVPPEVSPPTIRVVPGTVKASKIFASSLSEEPTIEDAIPDIPLPHRATNPIDRAEMVWIPPGDFIFGSREEAETGKKKSTKVYLSPYWIYRTPVTVAQFEKFCRSTRRKMPDPPSFNPMWLKKDHPMVNVIWSDAEAYCDWAGGRLPTEAEWEKAVRGVKGQVYPWGDTFDDLSLWCSVGVKRSGTASVRRSDHVNESPFGVRDAAGNVWEWCLDWYDPHFYDTASLRDPMGPNSGTARVLRGGAWDSYSSEGFRADARHSSVPSRRYYNRGFRCCLPATTTI